MKLCRRCGVERPLVEFCAESRNRDGKHSYCNPCKAKSTAAYREKTRVARALSAASRSGARLVASAASSSDRADRKRASRREYMRTYRAAHPRQFAEWVSENRPHYNETKRLRKAAAKRATPAWADPDVTRIFYIYGEALGMHVDHVTPLLSDLVCGLHWHGNMQLLTPLENIQKGNRRWPDMPEETI